MSACTYLHHLKRGDFEQENSHRPPDDKQSPLSDLPSASVAELKLEKHPDKTDMGRAEKRFDFLEYRFTPKGLCVTHKTIDNFIDKALRLYEDLMET